MKHLIILGAGGFGREIFCLAIESIGYGTDFDVKGFLDPDKHKLDGYEDYPPIIGEENTYEIQNEDVFICAFGDVNLKEKCCNKIKERGGRFITLIHKDAYISKNVSIGEGCTIMRDSGISCDIKIGNFVSIQGYVSIGHDVEISDFVYLGARAFIGGGAIIGGSAVLHTNAIILPLVKVGNHCVVGAGAVVIKKVKDGETVYGNPAKKLDF
jgi:sugar O-acyltransferase (sialic acid O-acetyltransferase NeuD family)